MKQVVTVRAIIKHNDKILLLRRRGGNPQFEQLYELPGGKVDFGEDPKATLQREVLEETGLEIATLQLSDAYSRLDISDLQKQYISLVFWAAVQDPQHVILSDEHNKYEWMKLSQIQLNDVTDFTRTELQLEALPNITDDSVDNSAKNADNKATKHKHVIVYSDGGSRGNPGPSASGFVVKDINEKLIFEGGKYIGITTNNQAEYQAVKLALEKALEQGAEVVQLRLDSQLVANQLNGVYQVKNPDLKPIFTAIKGLQTRFKQVTFTHVRREFNKEADAMVNKILDSQA